MKTTFLAWPLVLCLGFALPLAARGQQSAVDYLTQAGKKFASGDRDGALADFNQAIELRSTDAEPWFFRANIKSTMGDSNGALADYNRAIELDARFPTYFLHRGDLKLHLDDLSGALFDFDKAIELNPKNAQPW